MDEVINIIVPVYNAEKFIGRCLDSILQQEHQNWKLFLVEDHSKDHSYELCRAYAECDKRIHLLRTKENGGAAVARNMALMNIDYTKGVLTFVDADDFIHPGYLSHLLDLKKRYQADIAWVSVMNTFEPSKIEFPMQKEQEHLEFFSGKELLLHEEHRIMYSMVWGKLYDVSLWEKVRFPEQYKYFEDGATTFKVIYQSKIVIKSDKKLYGYFYSDNSSTRSEVTIQRLKDGISADHAKIEFYSQKGEKELLDMAYVAYLNTILKTFHLSLKCKKGKELRNLMKKEYKKTYPNILKCSVISKVQKVKYSIYYVIPDLQKVYIWLKMRVTNFYT